MMSEDQEMTSTIQQLRPSLPCATRAARAAAVGLLSALATLLAACGGSDDDPVPPPVPVAVAPVITTAPAATTVTEGDSASFSVTATGTAPLAYQWQRNGVAIAGATAATYAFVTALGDDNAQVRVVVSNSAGSATSAAALLRVNPRPRPPVLTTQPVSMTIAELNTVTLTVVVEGTPPFAYQWQRSPDGVAYADIAGATSASYTTPALSRADSGVRYRVIVSNAAGPAVTSEAAQITVNADAAVLAAAGGTVSGDNDKIRITVPAGALLGPTRFVITPRSTLDGLPSGYSPVPGAAYDVTWTGAGFAGARTVSFGILTAAPVVIASDRVRAAAGPAPRTAVSRCPGGTASISPSSTQGGSYDGGVATLCEGDGSVPTQLGLASPPPPPPSSGPWTQVGLPSLQRALGSVAFAGSSVAVALGTDARYIRSTDGGATWTQSTSPIGTNESGSVSFADSSVGVIVTSSSAGGRILRTTNAGVAWGQVFNSGAMGAVAFGSATVGVAAGLSRFGAPARILRTTDGGLTWSDSTISPGVGLNDFTGVAFADVNTVVVVGGNLLRRSTDGGQTFAAVTTPPGAAYRVAFGSPTAGVVVGFGNQVFWTADGGQTWSAGTGAALSSVTGFRDVTFLDASTAIAVGQGVGRGVILRSGDGGRTWTSVDAGITGVTVNFAVAFGSSTTGVVTGDTGSVLRTTTGGL
jgi:photosystem II stability/assembly factor-like uncharacterized protein